MRNRPTILGSLRLAAAFDVIAPERVLFVPTAANGLADRNAVVDTYREQFDGVDVIEYDVDDPGRSSDIDALASVDTVVMSGGNPYHLLRSLRTSGFDRALRAAMARGVGYVGVSAGALVAGPTLEPIAGISPFDRPGDLDLAALAVVDVVVLPHDDRQGRRVLHEQSLMAHAGAHPMLAITDDEVVAVRDNGWELRSTDRRQIRPAVDTDAAAIAECFLAAGRTAWTFLDPARFAELEPPEASWRSRIAERVVPAELLVAEDASGLRGVVWAHRAPDGDMPGTPGEVDAFYTHPRTWGSGGGRRLLDLALDQLRCAGCDNAFLYTEERNERARRVYEAAGWRTDGTVRDRRYLDAPIREVRYVRPL
ncbi:MAG: GNAT family N-acetyltransferase [Actinomycetota bacterium]